MPRSTRALQVANSENSPFPVKALGELSFHIGRPRNWPRDAGAPLPPFGHVDDARAPRRHSPLPLEVLPAEQQQPHPPQPPQPPVPRDEYKPIPPAGSSSVRHIPRQQRLDLFGRGVFSTGVTRLTHQ